MGSARAIQKNLKGQSCNIDSRKIKLNGNYNLVIILGAGASKPLGLPTSKEIVKKFLETQNAENLSDFKDLIIKEEWDVEKLLRLIQHVRLLGVDPPLDTLLGKNYTKSLKKKTIQLNKNFNSVYDGLLEFIRNACLKPDIEKAEQLYKPLLELRKEAMVKIFTTNYDTAIEDVCKRSRIEYKDGFASDTFDDYPKFRSETLGTGNLQLYKLHGSVNWWTDESRRDVFRLSLNLNGIEGLRTMIIYPAEIERAFNYPYNILQSHYILSLMQANRIIAIGHRFGDINVSSPIKALLEVPEFRLTIVSDSADETKNDVFNSHSNIQSVPKKVEDWITEGIKEIKKDIKSFESEREKKIAESKIRAEKERAELEARIRSEISQSSLSSLITTGAPIWTGTSVSPYLTSTTSGIVIRGEAIGERVCPNCQCRFYFSHDNKCPNCGKELS
jgi:hypothetical protein